MNRIYFDISATTPINPKVADFMNELQNTTYGNPSSIHREGQFAKAIIEKSRHQIANSLNCDAEEIIFTSSGSESNNMVLKGILKEGDHFITSSYEHPSILNVLSYLKDSGINISLVKPDKNGIIRVQDIENEIRDNTRLVSIMHVNNELGTINPITKIANLVKKRNILFHSDAVQAFGKITLDINMIPIDFLSMSAHKLYGPKGIGGLFIRRGNTLKPLIHGGGQESNLRASTENIAGIAGFGLASELASMDLDENYQYISNLEKHFFKQLDENKMDFKVNGINRIPGVLNITFNNIDGQNLVMQLDLAGIGISFGAACASGTIKPSSMLLDLGLNELEALSTVRFSFGKIHNKNDIEIVVNAIHQILVDNSKNILTYEG